MQQILVAVAILLAIIGNIPYIRDVINKKIHPHPFTWFIWTIVSFVTFFGALAKGAGLGALPILASEVFTFIIFILALFYGYRDGFKHVTKKDIIYLSIALLSLIPWYLTKDPTISVIIVVFIDLVAFIPTIRKTFDFPESENYILYLMNFSRHVLILITLDNYNIATSLHSVAMIITNCLMTYLIVFHTTKKFKKR
jgi:hypothetical protein